jgi:hypothetical protein
MLYTTLYENLGNESIQPIPGILPYATKIFISDTKDVLIYHWNIARVTLVIFIYYLNGKK